MMNRCWELPVDYEKVMIVAAPKLPGRMEIARRTKFIVISDNR